MPRVRDLLSKSCETAESLKFLLKELCDLCGEPAKLSSPNCGINKDGHTRPMGSLATLAPDASAGVTLTLCLSPWRKLYQFTAQLCDDFRIPAFLAHFDELFLLMRQLTTDLVKACGLAKCTRC